MPATLEKLICWVLQCTPYEDLKLANQKSRKLGVFGEQLDGSPYFIAILTNIRENEPIMLTEDMI